MEEAETQARSGLTRLEQVLWGRSIRKLLLHPTKQFSGILERNGPVGAGRYVAVYCLFRLVVYLSGLMFLVFVVSGPTDPTGAVEVFLALAFFCVVLAMIRLRTAALAGRKYRESCRPASEPGGSATGA
jgi:hypothetical protein